MALQTCKLVEQYYTHVKKLHAKRGVSRKKWQFSSYVTPSPNVDIPAAGK